MLKVDSRDAFNTSKLLRELAKPRMSGTEGAAEAAILVRKHFRSLELEIKEFPFSFSTIPGRFAISAAGVIFLLGTLGAAALMNMLHPGIALVILLVVMLLIGSIAVLAPALTSMLPFKRVEAANLLAHKPGSRPKYLLVAHLDTKSQPIPLAFRGPAIILAIVCYAAFVVFALLGVLDPVWIVPRVTTLLGVLCFIAGVLLVFCWVDNRSPGALDNASGVATVLGVAEQMSTTGDIGYLITDGEELGLVGARDIARKLDPVIGIINIDGIDDSGAFLVLEKFGVPPRHIAPHLVASLLTAAEEMKLPATRRNVPFGLLLDHIPLARRHLPAVTLMRGSLKSLRRVHRPADSMDSMSGSGIDTAVALVTRALKAMRAEPIGPRL